MKTLKEKVAYNQMQNTDFAKGYCRGVADYQNYPKLSAKDKKLYNKMVDNERVIATMGLEYFKGIMCGIRDAANERKAKKKK